MVGSVEEDCFGKFVTDLRNSGQSGVDNEEFDVHRRNSRLRIIRADAVGVRGISDIHCISKPIGCGSRQINGSRWMDVLIKNRGRAIWHSFSECGRNRLKNRCSSEVD